MAKPSGFLLFFTFAALNDVPAPVSFFSAIPANLCELCG
jgi:hypothetical protein